LVGSSGKVIKPVTIYGLPTRFYNRHMPGGQSAFGSVAFIIDQRETNLIFYYSDETENVVYLETDEDN